MLEILLYSKKTMFAVWNQIFEDCMALNLIPAVLYKIWYN